MPTRSKKGAATANPVELLRQRLAPPHETPANVRQRLVNAARGGGITLVLGAGVSIPRNIPSWDQLARAVWRKAFGDRASPWRHSQDGGSSQSLPQFLPIVFELASWKFNDEKKFVRALRQKLYEHAEFPSRDANFENSSETLAVLARLLVQEYKRGQGRRITSIISLNADDLIEQAVCRVAHARTLSDQLQTVRHIARSTHAYIGKRKSLFMPVYHLHGFLPSGHLKAYRGNYQYMLVFTDEQYWSTSASSASFANRVMNSALSEGVCIFVGMSMTDINLVRWLALRTLERDRDFEQGLAAADGQVSHFFTTTLQMAFRRHFWIRTKSEPHGDFLSQFLEYRGVSTVTVNSWKSREFEDLMKECFPLHDLQEDYEG